MSHYTRLAWGVSGQGRSLQAVLAAIEAGLLPVQMAMVMADRATSFEAVAKSRNIPYVQVTPWDSRRGGALIESLSLHRVDWLGLTFNRLLSSDVIDHLGGRIFNLHFSLLPMFAGEFPGKSIRQTLDAGMRLTGATVHMIDSTTDGGSILGQSICAVTADDTRETLGARMFGAALPLLLQIVRSIGNGELDYNQNWKKPRWQRAHVAPHKPVPAFPEVDADLVMFAEEFCVKLRN